MPLLEVRDLKKSYNDPQGGRQHILDIDSYALEPREQRALRGYSGSGKTTFLNIVAGILQPDSGDVLLDGRPLGTLSEAARDRERAAHVGFIFQTFNLLQGLTALENVMVAMSFGKGSDRARAQHLLERVGLETRMNYRPSQLSTGQQQRVAVARALANRPRLLLADEPTGNLDPRNAEEVLRLVREVARESEAALLLVSHDQKVLDAFEQVDDFVSINRTLQP